MSTLGWLIVLALPLYAAVQLWLISLIGRRFVLDEDADVTVAAAGGFGVDTWTDSSPSGEPFGPPSPVSVVRCHVCGWENDLGYTFCGNCVARLAYVR